MTCNRVQCLGLRMKRKPEASRASGLHTLKNPRRSGKHCPGGNSLSKQSPPSTLGINERLAFPRVLVNNYMVCPVSIRYHHLTHSYGVSRLAFQFKMAQNSRAPYTPQTVSKVTSTPADSRVTNTVTGNR